MASQRPHIPEQAADEEAGGGDGDAPEQDADDGFEAGIGNNSEADDDPPDDGSPGPRAGPIYAHDGVPDPSPEPSNPPSSAVAASRAIEAWMAQYPKLEWDPAVARLYDDVRARRNLTMWATSDLDALLPVVQLPRAASLTHAARTIEAIRNIAVFVPVAITWLAIRGVTMAFNGAVAQVGDVGELSLIQFWMTGRIPGEASIDTTGTFGLSWLIQDVALHVAGIIIMVVVLTLAAILVRSRARRIEDRESVQAERDRIRAIVDVKRHLYGYREATPTSIADSLAESLSDLQQATRSLAETATQVETSTASVTDGFTDLGPIVRAVQEDLARIERAFSTSMAPTIETLSTTVQGLSQAIGKDYSHQLESAIAGLAEVAEQMARVGASIEFGTKQMRDDLEAISGRLGAALR